jgi:hypothetical protein
MRFIGKNLSNGGENHNLSAIEHPMEENVLTPIPEFKMYSIRSVYIGTFIGGPLIAGYLAAQNFKQMQQPDLVKRSWGIAIAATVLLIAGLLLIPGIQKIPTYIIPLVYTFLARYFVERYQGGAIKLHIERNGLLYSAWRSVWIGLIGSVILIGLLVILLVVTGVRFPMLPS